jgi:Periplasmic copper-binding protein (NosD)
MPDGDSSIPEQLVLPRTNHYGGIYEIHCDDVFASETPCGQSSRLNRHLDRLRDRGGGKLILAGSCARAPIWIDRPLELDGIPYLEICGQGDPGLSGGYGTVLRQVVTTENSERNIFHAGEISGNGVYSFHDFAMWGAAETWPSFGDGHSKFVSLYGAERVTVRNVGGYYNRLMVMAFARCGLVEVTNCRAERNVAAYNFADCNRRVITDNVIRHGSDDAIAILTNYLSAYPIREPSTISGNLIEDSYGIKVEGGCKVSITNNKIDRAKGHAIAIFSAGGGGYEGESDNTDIVVAHNLLTNTIQANKFSKGSSNSAISITNDTNRYAAPVQGGPIPFINCPETVSPYSNAKDSTNAGGQRILITDNVIAQTLPQVNKYSDWGLGLFWWYDGFKDLENFHSEFHCQTNGVLIGGAWVDVTVKDNVMERLMWGVICSIDFAGLAKVSVTGNEIRRVPYGGGVCAHNQKAVKHGKLDVRDNDIDGDPFFESANRIYKNGSQAAVTISAGSPAVISWPGHGLPKNTAVRFTTTGTLPAGLTPSSTVGARSYYVRGGSTLLLDSFTVAAYRYGPAINTTDAGSGVHTAFSSIPDGSWTKGNQSPKLADVCDWDGAAFTGNRIRNLNALVLADAETRTFAVEGNIVFMQPCDAATAAAPGHASNKGVRDPGNFLRSGTLVYEDSDPTSATYGHTTNRAPARYATTMPTAGFFLAGEIVWNCAYSAAGESALIAWLRMRTGTGHAKGVDWTELRALTGSTTPPPGEDPLSALEHAREVVRLLEEGAECT